MERVGLSLMEVKRDVRFLPWSEQKKPFVILPGLLVVGVDQFRNEIHII